MTQKAKRRKNAEKPKQLSPRQTKRLNERLQFWEKKIQSQRQAVADSERLTEADFAVMINTRG